MPPGNASGFDRRLPSGADFGCPSRGLSQHNSINQPLGTHRMHPLNSVKGAITTGLVLAVIIGILLTTWSGLTSGFHPVRIDRWLHIVSGVTWIGLLYYFNVVQTPGLAAAAADKGGPGRAR